MSSSLIAITGSHGIIGTVLLKGLTGFNIKSLNLPEVDARNYEQLLSNLNGVDTVIHLAKSRDKSTEESSNEDDLVMARNVYKAAVEAKVGRVIMASSVHADNFYDWKGADKLSVDRDPVPFSAYGADKVYIEDLGRKYSKQKLDVFCVRFGGVNAEDRCPENDYWEAAVWLSHEDCVAMMKKCISSDKIPHNFVIFYAVSNNKNSVHDTSNPVNWQPR